MLRNLRIKNLALVDDVQVGFNGGLNVITGETGAGKSLLIGALRLLLGERADKSMMVHVVQTPVIMAIPFTKTQSAESTTSGIPPPSHSMIMG